MLSNREAHSIMAAGLGAVESTASAVVNVEQNRQMVAVNNFMWRTDQLLWRRDDSGAGKMLNKALGVASRMSAVPPALALELRIRQQLLVDRAQVFPQIGVQNNIPFPPSPAPIEAEEEEPEFTFQVCDGASEAALDVIALVRDEAFANDFYYEPDGRDVGSRFVLAFRGDELVGGARMRLLDHVIDFPVHVLDQVFVARDCQQRGLGRALLTQAKMCSAPLFLALRPSWKAYAASIAKLSSSSYQVYKQDVFLPNLTQDSAGGVFVTLLEPRLQVM